MELNRCLRVKYKGIDAGPWLGYIMDMEYGDDEMLLSNTPASDLRWARSTGTTACMIEFQAWLEDGFRLNTATLTKKCKLRLRAWRAGRRPTGRGSAA